MARQARRRHAVKHVYPVLYSNQQISRRQTNTHGVMRFILRNNRVDPIQNIRRCFHIVANRFAANSDAIKIQGRNKFCRLLAQVLIVGTLNDAKDKLAIRRAPPLPPPPRGGGKYPLLMEEGLMGWWKCL